VGGRLGDGARATLELVEGALVVEARRGLLGFTRETTRIPLEEVTSLEHLGESPSHRGAASLRVAWAGGELSFHTLHREELAAIALETRRALEERERRLREMEREFHASLEGHLALLVLDMELADALLSLAAGLHGPVDWSRVEEHLRNAQAVNQDRAALESPQPTQVCLESLAHAVEERQPREVLAEVWRVVEALSAGCKALAEEGDPWFDARLHPWFLEALVGLWTVWLGSETGVEGLDPEALEPQLQALAHRVQETTGTEATPPTPNQPPPEARATLLALAQQLEATPFQPHLF